MFRSIILLVLLVNALHGEPVIKNVYRGEAHFEEPHWSISEKVLYWSDAIAQLVHRLDPETGNVTTRNFGYGPVSIVMSVKDNPGVILVTVRTGLYLLNWTSTQMDDSALKLLSVVDLGLPKNRCNDGKVDAKGRLWFGTMGKQNEIPMDPDQATVYMMDQYNYVNPAIKVKPVSVSNGLTWSLDNKYLYYIDSLTNQVDIFDFDVESAIIRNRRTFFNLLANNISGNPDGMTIDSDGNLWVACVGAGLVIKISSTGELLQKFQFPCTRVTSVMWGGLDLATLYVTTSRSNLTLEEIAQQPQAGSLFSLEGTGSKGIPENQFVFPNAKEYANK